MARRPTSRYQSRDAGPRRIALLAARSARASVKQALKALPDMLDLEKTRTLIRNGRAQDVVREAIDWHHFRQVVRHPFERLARAYEAGAELGQRKINNAFSSRGRGVRFVRKGGPGDSRVQRVREENHRQQTGGSEADSDVTECLRVLKRESSVASWPKE